MELIAINVTRREGSKRVHITAQWYPHGLRMGRRASAEMHADSPDAGLGQSEMWDLLTALREEVKGWQAKLPLDYS
jgi:hypothetical protein